MAAPSETYVDPAINANTGTGTIGDPYGDLQYALDTMTSDATNGDRINIKSGTAEVLTGTISLASYGSAARSRRLIFEGYDSAAGDGGIGAIDGNNGNFNLFNGGNDLLWKNLKLFNTGTADILRLANYSQVINCELAQTSSVGVYSAASSSSLVTVTRCYFHDIAGNATSGVGNVNNCYFANGTTDKFTEVIDNRGFTSWTVISNCLFNLDGSSVGMDGHSYKAINNSILSSSGTGTGLKDGGVAEFYNNLIEGFSGTGGQGFYFSLTDPAAITHNAFYNCATNIAFATGCELIYDDDNESLGASPFAKTGSLPTDFTSATFWSDLYSYFAPVDTGNVYNGYPSGSNQTKGAVGQPVGGGGTSGPIRHPLARLQA